MFNPRVKDFLKKKPNITLIGLGWAFYWRFAVLVLGVELILFIIFMFFAALARMS